MRYITIFFCLFISAVSSAQIRPQENLHNAILFIRAQFKSNMGRPVLPTCDEACLFNTLWGPNGVQSYFSAQSQGKMGFDPTKSRVITVDLDTYASSLGCITDSWMEKALTIASTQQGIDTSQYTFKMMLLPVSAGGGSCARFPKVRAQTPDVSNFKSYSWLRSQTAASMVFALGQNIGLKNSSQTTPSFNQSVVDNSTQDLSDPINNAPTSYIPGLNAPHIYQAGWFPSPPQNIVETSFSEATIDIALQPLSNLLNNKTSPVVAKFGDYWVSLRTNAGLDISLSPDLSNKVYVHKITPSGTVSVSGPLSLGSRFIDAESNSVEFVQFVNNTAYIRLRRCVHIQPTLSSQTLQNGKVAITMHNNDLNCPVPRYRLQAQCGSVPCNFGDTLTPVEVSLLIVPDINRLEIEHTFSVENTVVIDAKYPSGFNSFNYTLSQNQIGKKLTLKMFDHGGDGICCQYGGGSYYDIKVGNALIFRGGVFGYSQTTSFPALPHYSASVESAHTVVLSYDPNSVKTPFFIELTQVDPWGNNNGLTKAFLSY